MCMLFPSDKKKSHLIFYKSDLSTSKKSKKEDGCIPKFKLREIKCLCLLKSAALQGPKRWVVLSKQRQILVGLCVNLFFRPGRRKLFSSPSKEEKHRKLVFNPHFSSLLSSCVEVKHHALWMHFFVSWRVIPYQHSNCILSIQGRYLKQTPSPMWTSNENTDGNTQTSCTDMKREEWMWSPEGSKDFSFWHEERLCQLTSADQFTNPELPWKMNTCWNFSKIGAVILTCNGGFCHC